MLFPVLYGGEPPAPKLLQLIMKPYETLKRNNGVPLEVFPHPNRTCRLPFGPSQHVVTDIGPIKLLFEEKMYWLNKLDPVDLPQLNRRIADLVAAYSKDLIFPSATLIEQGNELRKTGLAMDNSRHDSQFLMLKACNADGMTESDGRDEVFQVILTMHNNFSKQILTNPNEVYNEIQRQAKSVWNYQPTGRGGSNLQAGFITKQDLITIIECTNGSLPKMKFLYEMVLYFNARHHRPVVTVHTESLIRWSSRSTYGKRLEELEAAGIVTRGKSYQIQTSGQPGRAKSTTLNWSFQPVEDAVLVHGRSPTNLKEAVKVAFTLDELINQLSLIGPSKRNIRRRLSELYEKQ